MKLKIKPAHLEAIASHALRTIPLECCGLLLGHFEEKAIERLTCGKMRK